MNLPEGYIGLCALCTLNLNAAMTARVGHQNRGVAKESEGERLAFGTTRWEMNWAQGAEIPAGMSCLSDIALHFGTDADIRTFSGRLPLFATTMIYGTLACELHAGQLYTDRKQGRPVPWR